MTGLFLIDWLLVCRLLERLGCDDEAEAADAAGVANGNAVSAASCSRRWRQDTVSAVLLLLPSGELHTLLQPTGVLDAEAFIISLRGFSSSTVDSERP